MKKFVAGCLMVALTAQTVWSDEAATREILAVTPADMAGCIMIEDLGGHCRRIGASPFWHRAVDLPVVRTILERPDVRGALAAQAMLPVLVGVRFEELRDSVFGSSVVFAFRPATKPNQKDAGIVYCNIANDDVRNRFWNALTKPNSDRKIDVRKHQGVDYLRRVENGKQEFLIQMGNVLALTDREELVQASIDARARSRGLNGSRAFAAALENLPKGCLVRIVFDPRAFDAAIGLATSTGKTPLERETGASVLATWKSIDWAGATLRIDDRVEFGCHAAVDVAKLPGDIRGWLDQPTRPSEVWKLAPAGALLAATCEVDFADLGKAVEAMLAASTEPDARALLDAMTQLVPGYDLSAQVLPRLGPETCTIVLPGNAERGIAGPGAKLNAGAVPAGLTSWFPSVVACIRTKPDESPDGAAQAGRIPLHEAIEYGLRPLLVLAGVEHNRKTGDTVRAEVLTAGARRIHSLTGSKQLPIWLEPAFCATRDWLVFGTSSIAIRELFSGKEGSLADSPKFKDLVARFPKGFSMTMYVSFERLSESLAGVEQRAVERLKIGGTSSVAASTTNRKSSVLGLFDCMVAGGSNNSGVFHWTATILPANDASFR